MRTAASRLPKGFSLEERLAACASNVESHPKDRAGQWRCWAPLGERRGDPYAAVVLDLGCGKGEYTVECAAARPDVLFVGLDVDGVCVMRAAERAIAQGVSNAVFVLHDDSDLSETFGEGELSAMLLNFPTPFPKKKKAHYRLTHFERLMSYRPLLAPGAFVRLRTDSMPLRDFSLTQLEIAGYDVQWNTDDVRGMFPNEPWSGYEHKLVAQGAPVCGFAAVPGPAPENRATFACELFARRYRRPRVRAPWYAGVRREHEGPTRESSCEGSFGMDASDYLVRWGPRRMGIYRELRAVTLALVYFPC